MVSRIAQRLFEIPKPNGYPHDTYLSKIASVAYFGEEEYKVFADRLYTYESRVLHYVLAYQRVMRTITRLDKYINNQEEPVKWKKQNKLANIIREWSQELKVLLKVDTHTLSCQFLEKQLDLDFLYVRMLEILDHSSKRICPLFDVPIRSVETIPSDWEDFDLVVDGVMDYQAFMRFLMLSRLLESRPISEVTLFVPTEEELYQLEFIKDLLKGKEKFYIYFDIFNNKRSIDQINVKEFVKYIGNIYFPKKDYRLINFFSENDCNEVIKQEAFISVLNHTEFSLKDALENFEEKDTVFNADIYSFLVTVWRNENLLAGCIDSLKVKATTLSSSLMKVLLMELEDIDWLLLFEPETLALKFGRENEARWQNILEGLLSRWDAFYHHYDKKTYCTYWEYLFKRKAISYKFMEETFTTYLLQGGNDPEVIDGIEPLMDSKAEEIFDTEIKSEEMAKKLNVLGYHLIGSDMDLNQCVANHPSWFEFENDITPIEGVNWSYTLVKYGLSKKDQEDAIIRAVVRADVDNEDLLMEMLNDLENI